MKSRTSSNNDSENVIIRLRGLIDYDLNNNQGLYNLMVPYHPSEDVPVFGNDFEILLKSGEKLTGKQIDMFMVTMAISMKKFTYLSPQHCSHYISHDRVEAGQASKSVKRTDDVEKRTEYFKSVHKKHVGGLVMVVNYGNHWYTVILQYVELAWSFVVFDSIDKKKLLVSCALHLSICFPNVYLVFLS